MWYDVLGIDIKEKVTMGDVNAAYYELYNKSDESNVMEIIDAYISACQYYNVKKCKKRRKFGQHTLRVKLCIIYVLALAIILLPLA